MSAPFQRESGKEIASVVTKPLPFTAKDRAQGPVIRSLGVFDAPCGPTKTGPLSVDVVSASVRLIVYFCRIRL